ncbi:MAG: hypothetical protein HS102_07705 [Planctomycetia bacterium]|nr:hypothetical protein [Planctomycetia bacterium]
MTAVSSGELNVQGKQFGGEAVFSGHMDDDFIAEVQVKLNSGKDAAIYFRYLDPDNWYRARLQGTPVGRFSGEDAQGEADDAGFGGGVSFRSGRAAGQMRWFDAGGVV